MGSDETQRSRISQELPGDWEDVSDNTPFEYHWHRNPEAGDYPSIRIGNGNTSDALAGFHVDEWVVEMYPSPEHDDGRVLRTTHETLWDAVDRVLELMEEYPHAE